MGKATSQIESVGRRMRRRLVPLSAVDSRACFDASVAQDEAIGCARAIARLTIDRGLPAGTGDRYASDGAKKTWDHS